jgi:hypothetical protein
VIKSQYHSNILFFPNPLLDIYGCLADNKKQGDGVPRKIAALADDSRRNVFWNNSDKILDAVYQHV